MHISGVYYASVSEGEVPRRRETQEWAQDSVVAIQAEFVAICAEDVRFKL